MTWNDYGRMVTSFFRHLFQLDQYFYFQVAKCCRPVPGKNTGTTAVVYKSDDLLHPYVPKGAPFATPLRYHAVTDVTGGIKSCIKPQIIMQCFRNRQMYRH